MSYFTQSQPDMSKFKVFSIGIAVKDKEKFSDELEVYIVEQFPYVEGKIDKAEVKYEAELPDATGNIKNSTVQGGYTLTARWLPDGSNNQMTAPDVYKNETVKIYKFGDSDKYFWSTIFREPRFRKQETVATMYSNLKDPSKEGYDKESSYWTQVDTRDKKWQLHTSKNDGEKCAYDMEINTKEGNITIKDDLGNMFKLDSSSNTLSMENADGSKHSISSGNSEMTAPGSCTSTCQDYSNKSSSYSVQSDTGTSNFSTSYSMNVAGMGISLGGESARAELNRPMDLKSTEDIKMETEKEMHLKPEKFTLEVGPSGIDIKCDGNITITCKKLIIEGDIEITGDIDVKGDVEIQGDVEIKGDLDVRGNFTNTGGGGTGGSYEDDEEEKTCECCERCMKCVNYKESLDDESSTY